MWQRKDILEGLVLSQVDKGTHEFYLSSIWKSVLLVGWLIWGFFVCFCRESFLRTQRVGGFFNFYCFPGSQGSDKIQYCHWEWEKVQKSIWCRCSKDKWERLERRSEHRDGKSQKRWHGEAQTDRQVYRTSVEGICIPGSGVSGRGLEIRSKI